MLQEQGDKYSCCETREEIRARARKVYAKLHRASHTESSVKECGFSNSSVYFFLGASPDGIITCSCCDGVAGLEIKTTTVENLHSCADENGQIKRDHSFYYQVQTQILACNLTFVDLFLYVDHKTYAPYRIYPDPLVQEEIKEKSENYFKRVILPELVAKHFSLSGNTVVSDLLRDSANLGTIICSCRAPKAGKTVLCAGKECLHKEFHFRYESVIFLVIFSHVFFSSHVGS